jgi:type I restriction enzyme, S subunit
MTSRFDASYAVVRRTGVPTGWTEKQVSDLVRIISGGTPDRNESAYWRDGGVPWITPTDLTANHGKYISIGAEHISESGLASSNARLVPVGSIVFSTRGTVGNLAIASVPLTSNQSCEVLVPKNEETCSEFLYYLLNYGMFAFHRLAGGTTFGSITRREISRVHLALPKRNEQTAITRILDAVDTTIEQTFNAIEQAKQLTRSLAMELLECGIDDIGAVRSKDDSSNRFKTTELGLLPESWMVKRLSDVADVERGRFSPRPRNDPRFYGGPFPFVQTGLIAKAKGREITEFSQTLNHQGKAVSREFPAGTIMVTIAANIGETAILGIPMCAPDSLVGVVVKAPHSTRFIELCLRRLRPRLLAMAPRSAQANINLTTLKPLRIPVPPPIEQEKIAAIINTAEAKVIALETRLEALRQLKKSLMHDLFTGTVRVDPALFKEQKQS